MGYSKYIGTQDNIRGLQTESDFEAVCPYAVKASLEDNKKKHIDYWLDIDGVKVGVDVKSNKWWKGNGCVELKAVNKEKYIANAYNVPYSGAIWSSSWSESHTNGIEWLVFKMPDGYKVIDRTNNNFVKLVVSILKNNNYKVAVRQKYNAYEPYTLFSN